MSKPVLGLLLGAVLGLLDGLSAFLSPEAAPMMVQIVVGSTIKGLLTGLLAGVFARKTRSLALGITFAVAVGLFLSYLTAMTPDPQGNHHYFEIMLPGAILAAIVGFATQRYGRAPQPADGGGRTAAALVLLLGGGPALLSAATPKAAENPLAPVQFLLGEWKGTAEGRAGTGAVRRTYRMVLGDKFLHERNVSTYPPQASNKKGEVHEHWSLFSYDRARRTVVFRQFHQEGFVNQYVLQAGAPAGTVTFETEAIENIPAGWKARETYQLVSPDEFVETFELAQGAGAYEVYSTTRFKRARR